MCGICGEVSFDGPPNGEAVRRMTAAMVHRGPDAGGYHEDGPVAMGHRRLSVLDIAGGAQPMVREGIAIVFNGQIYDHKALRTDLQARGHPFTTRSDTEVVLRAFLEWGEGFVEHLHGMFALAVWDRGRRRLVLARDRLGKKPLYYAFALGRSRLVFASELKALLAHGGIPRDPDPQALVEYLAVEYVPAPRSAFQAVKKLPAAHAATWDGQGLELRRYWDLPVPSIGAVDVREASGEFLRLLDRAVSTRLVADVTVGVLLSGGIDSTTVAALAARTVSPLRTFSIGFEESSFDETRFAELAAARLGTIHHSAKLSARACIDTIPEAVEVLDEPFGDPSILPTLLLSHFTRQQAKVALTGDGGDELFAGYDPFLAHRPARLFGALPGGVVSLLQAFAGLLPPRHTHMSLEFRLKQFLRGLAAEPSLRHQAWIGSFLPEELSRLLVPDLRPLARPEAMYGPVMDEATRSAGAGLATGSVDEALRFYVTRYLADDILVKADRASMAASLELRSPFLDTSVVEFVMRLPVRAKLSLTRTKVLLRRAAKGLVPEEILHRPKKGFGIPVGAWIRGPLRPLFEDLFSPATLSASGILDAKEARLLLDRHLRGAADLRKPLWTLAMLLLWQRRWAR
jgi:asparagine synthase (glutamine-hydrolysing)